MELFITSSTFNQHRTKHFITKHIFYCSFNGSGIKGLMKNNSFTKLSMWRCFVFRSEYVIFGLYFPGIIYDYNLHPVVRYLFDIELLNLEILIYAITRVVDKRLCPRPK